MKAGILKLVMTFFLLDLIGCAPKIIQLQNDSLKVVNREIVQTSTSKNSLTLNRAKGDGMAILKDIHFDRGIIELEFKGENNPQKSFIGVAFNIQNDSMYEAVYFRPFNFQSDIKIRREHAVQYIYKPEFEWRFLRANYKGQFEAEFPRRPSPDDWFEIRVIINDKKVIVYDLETNTELLSIERLAKQVSNKIGLWTGYNSKGAFRKIKIKKEKTNSDQHL